MVRLKTQYVSLFLSFSLFLCAALPASAQEVSNKATNLFTDASNARGNIETALNNVGQRRLEKLKRDPTTESVRLVRISGNLSQRRTLIMRVGENRALAPNVNPIFQRERPGREPAKKNQREQVSRTLKLFVRRDRVKALDEGTYIWRGAVLGGPGKKEEIGDATLYHGTEGDITGTIRLGGETYLIRPLNEGLHALVAEDESKYPSGGNNPLHDGGDAIRMPSSPSSTTESPRSSSTDAPKSSCAASMAPVSQDVEVGLGEKSARENKAPCPQYAIDVLAVYTSDAANNYSINGIINTAIDEANQAYDNSNADGVELSLAHSQEANINGIGVGDIEDDLGDLQSSSSVQSLRDQHEADVVVLFTDAGYTSGGLDIHGAAEEVRAEAEDAYAIVEASAATGGEFTFPHEIGHLQGAQHHPNDQTCSQGQPQCDPEGHIFPDAYGHRFFGTQDCAWWKFWCDEDEPVPYRTMMAYDSDYDRIKHFSDPNVTYDGEPTGTSNQNNANALRTTVGTVENFRGASDLKARLSVTSGNPNDPDMSDYTFEAAPCGGSDGYSYEWRISYHGPSNYGNVLGTSQTFTKSFPPGTHFVKVTVQSNNGQQDSAIRSITFDPYPSSSSTTTAKTSETSKRSNRKTARQPKNPDHFALRLAGPNPVETSTTLAYDLPERSPVELVVYDITGREVKRLVNETHEAGTHRIHLNAASLPSGAFVVRVNAGKKQRTKRITVVK